MKTLQEEVQDFIGRLNNRELEAEAAAASAYSARESGVGRVWESRAIALRAVGQELKDILRRTEGGRA